MYTDVKEGEIIDIVLQAVMPPPPKTFNEDCSDIYSPYFVTEIVSEWGWKALSPPTLL